MPQSSSSRPHDRIAQSLALRLAPLGLSPNGVTLASIPPALLAGVAASAGWMATAAVLFTLSGVLDLLDGALARATGQQTRFGALLDSSLDRVADAAVPIGLVVLFAPYGWLAAIPAMALLAGMWVSYIRARAQSLAIALPRLWMRREDRFGLMTAAMLLSAWHPDLGSRPYLPVLVACGVIAVLGLLAGADALRRAAKQANGQKP